MIPFHEFFYKRANEIINQQKSKFENEDCFFVFRGFDVAEIQTIIKDRRSILSDDSLILDGYLNITYMHEHRKQLLTHILRGSFGICLGFYEELIAIVSTIPDFESLFNGEIIIIQNNLFSDESPCVLSQVHRNILAEYIQSDGNNASDLTKTLALYYSDIRIWDENNAVVSQFNVHKDLKCELIDFFPELIDKDGLTRAIESANEIQIGTDNDKILRLNLMRDDVKGVNIRYNVSGNRIDFLNRSIVSIKSALSSLQIPYNIEKADTLSSDFEYEADQFLPLLRKYWGKQARFRDIAFYKDPLHSKEKQSISQGSLISEIIDQCEAAQDDENFRDIFITAPTGAGKSLLFQLPALHIAQKYELVTIVISPLIALMNDQVAQLEKKGVTIVTCINSSLSFEERQNRIDEIRRGIKSIIYIAPESLLATGVNTLLGDRKIGLFVIDEAHIVTSWGRDFRADYWFLSDFIRATRKKNNSFPVLCLTATAVYTGNDDVVEDTMNELDLNDPILHLGNVRRSNIGFDIVLHKNETRQEVEESKLALLLCRLRIYTSLSEKVLVYCPYRSQVEAAYNELTADERHIIRRYHGRIPREEKNITESEYRQGYIMALICTKAFGMGVDRGDIKHIIHYAPTGNLSDYVQEIGRAARNKGMEGRAHMDYYPSDMHYVRVLQGLSEMRQFQLRAMLKKLFEIFKIKGKRNLLISPDTFAHLFNQDELEQKTKSGLLLLSKDLKNIYGFPVLVVRPRAMLTRIFVSVPDSLDGSYRAKFGCYSYDLGYVPDGFLPDSEGGTRIKYTGRVYSLNIGELWEKSYAGMSFGAFKQKLFDPDFFCDSDGNHLAPRIQVNVVYHVEYQQTAIAVERFLNGLLAVLYLHKNAAQKSFTAMDFSEELNDRLENKLERNQMTMLLDLFTFEVEWPNISSNRKFYKILQRRKSQKNNEVSEYIVSGSYASLKANMLRLLGLCSPDKQGKFSSYAPFTKNRSIAVMPVLKLLEILGLASYDLKGGEMAEVFVRINDPLKIKRLSESDYRNGVLQEIVRRHRDGQELLKRFFEARMSNEERWDFIEEYFLGREV